MQNPHIIVGPGARCLCGSYNIGGEERKPVCCDDLITTAIKNGNAGDPQWQMVAAMILPLIEDRG